MSLRTKIGLGAAVAVVGYAVLNGLNPFYYEQGGSSRTPDSVTLQVTWATGGGVEKAGITWNYSGMPEPITEEAHGGFWRRDIRLPSKGTFVVTLTGRPKTITRDNGQGGTFDKSAVSTCLIKRMAGERRHTQPAVPGTACHVTDVVVVA